ncbi:chemotaxis response regulator protein-glutamate methylesterase [Marinitoga sp. 1138]|uniref:protein-glutamate methylesterase/protein-glutamine glutaminase n=1 Tax=Marinitoga sp. 1138 TaxID=1643334 RepID=UPI0015862920|nr:chemotaxis response regulator protein-glutamate methylesterase [Marinitoga sp. 1138]NUU96910.1 chemotaxis protein CheY [Marinitoga sp. 1138]
MEKIKVLIADDSALMRKLLKKIIESDRRFEVIATARDGEDAVLKARKVKPDVITMDVNMPKMDGLTAVQYIVEEKIAPVIVVSSLTQKGSITAYEALELGAFDYIGKPEGTVSKNIYSVRDELLKKLLAAYESSRRTTAFEHFTKIKKSTEETPVIKKKTLTKSYSNFDYYAIAIGISTGGPKTIYDVIPLLPSDLNAAVFLVQHMPPQFTKQYAERLNKYSKMLVVEAEDDMVVEPGVVYVGKGGYHLKVRKGLNGVKIRLSKVPRHLFMPSVDIMMDSVSNVYKDKTIGVLMTGMGDDGAEAMKKIKKMGGYTIAESEETAVVFGMPAEAIKRGGASIVLPSYKIAEELIKKADRRR